MYEDSDTKSNRQTIHEDEQEGNTALVPESQSFDESVEDEEDEGGRFFGGGITSETAGALDFVDERDKTDPMVGSKSLDTKPSDAYLRLLEVGKD